MVEEKRDTVVVEKDGDRSGSPLGWIIGVIVLILVVLFFLNGGFGLFGGTGTQGGSDTNINVQPTTGQ